MKRCLKREEVVAVIPCLIPCDLVTLSSRAWDSLQFRANLVFFGILYMLAFYSYVNCLIWVSFAQSI